MHVQKERVFLKRKINLISFITIIIIIEIFEDLHMIKVNIIIQESCEQLSCIIFVLNSLILMTLMAIDISLFSIVISEVEHLIILGHPEHVSYYDACSIMLSVITALPLCVLKGIS